MVSVLFRGTRINRDQLIQALKEQSVDSRPFFSPMHEMDVYKKYARTTFPVAEELAKVGLNLPTSSSMTNDTLDVVIDKLKRVLEVYERA